MSEAALLKIQKDCQKLEAELEVHKNTKTLKETSPDIVTYITTNNEPFQVRSEPSPWATSADGGGCIIS